MPVENILLISIRFLIYVDFVLLVGLSAFRLYGLTSEERSLPFFSLKTPAVVLSLGGILMSALGIFVIVASMTGTSISTVNSTVINEIIRETAMGTAWIVRMLALSVAIVFALLLNRGRFADIGFLAAVSLALATLAWNGHAGASEHWIGGTQILVDVLHMVAASIWIGGIAALLLLSFRPLCTQTQETAKTFYRLLSQFSMIGTVIVSVLSMSGLINGFLVLGLPEPMTLLGSAYGQLLLAKLGLFAVMLVLAALNRWLLTPILGATIDDGHWPAAIRGLRTSLIMEACVAMLLLSLVAWLGTLEPPRIA